MRAQSVQVYLPQRFESALQASLPRRLDVWRAWCFADFDMTNESMSESAPHEGDVVWRPSPEQARDSGMNRFRQFCEERMSRSFADRAALHAWTLEEPEAFWDAVWDFAGLIGDKGDRVVEPSETFTKTRFFPDATLSFAENLLAKRGPDDAIVFWSEDKAKRRLSWDELRALVSRLQQALADAGIRPGDRVASLLPNMPETIAFMLATVSLGGIWSSASPDFGPGAAVDRLGQVEPSILITCDGYWYAGKSFAMADKVVEIAGKLPSVEKIVVVPHAGGAEMRIDKAVALETFLAPFEAREPRFERFPIDHPLYILFSSGTTGTPKCIVHRAGVLLQHASEHRIHCDVRPGDRVFYFTTTSWMMWNWLASALACEATLVLYDGSPFHPRKDILLDYAQEERVTLFGTSARYIDGLRQAEKRPIDTHDLSAMRTICSTGSPLAPINYGYVYDAIKRDVHLASISGGTDICGCFVLADPTAPVRIGEIQAPALGLAVTVWDEKGKPVAPGTKGELVCTAPFPSMPLKFWNDPEDERYHDAYFARFPNVWHHGDYAEVTPHGGFVIHGRSDATLNPGGVRIGTAEIYAQVEKIEEVMESLAIGQSHDFDTRVVLFVRLKDGATLDEALTKRIKQTIKTGATPRHVPAVIVAVPDIPRTASGKIVEIAVRDIVNGREVKNRDALANPEALDFFKDVPELKPDTPRR